MLYRPPTLVLGVGCSLGAPADEIESLARSALPGAPVRRVRSKRR